MSTSALRVIDLPAVTQPVRSLHLVPQPRPRWQQLSLTLSPAEAPQPAAPPSADPQYEGMPDVDVWVRQLVVGSTRRSSRRCARVVKQWPRAQARCGRLCRRFIRRARDVASSRRPPSSGSERGFGL